MLDGSAGTGADEPGRAHREKLRVALSSVLAAVLLTAIKLGMGLWTNSLGILAEAVHSGLDLVAAGTTYWAVTISAKPPDRRHTYGHGKFENLSAMIETALLLLTCAWIVYEAVGRLWVARGVEVNTNIWAFAVILVAIVVDYSRSRALRRVAVRYHSQALEADALHFTTDIWSSIVVFFGLLCVFASRRFHIAWLVKADAIAALCVALIVVWASLRLGKQAVNDLLDAVPDDLPEKISAAAMVPGVQAVERVRVRRGGGQTLADVTLKVGQAVSLENAHEIASRAEEAIRALIPDADLVAHVEPAATPQDDLVTRVRVIAARYGLGAHGIRIYAEEGNLLLDLHLEVSDALTLEEAHRLATEFEKSVREVIPGLASVVTHIEPSGDAAAVMPSKPAGEAEIRKAIEGILSAEHLAAQPHDIRVRAIGNEYAVSCHCTLEQGLGIRDAHDLTERVEKRLRSQVPNLARVIIHVEPNDDGSPA